MAKKLTKIHIEKMKQGRQGYIDQRNEALMVISENIKVGVDKYQYILRVDDEYMYFSDIEDVLNELLKDRIKKLIPKKKVNKLERILSAVLEARQWIEEVASPNLKSFFKTMHNAQSKK